MARLCVEVPRLCDNCGNCCMPKAVTTAKALQLRPGDFKGRDAMEALVVKQLRSERTEGIMDCRKALIDSGWDIDKARELLRKQGVNKI